MITVKIFFSIKHSPFTSIRTDSPDTWQTRRRPPREAERLTSAGYSSLRLEANDVRRGKWRRKFAAGVGRGRRARVNERRIIQTGMDRIRNDECGVMNDELKTALDSSFRIHHSSFLPYPVHPC
jgi:hypothetical protein